MSFFLGRLLFPQFVCTSAIHNKQTIGLFTRKVAPYMTKYGQNTPKLESTPLYYTGKMGDVKGSEKRNGANPVV